MTRLLPARYSNLGTLDFLSFPAVLPTVLTEFPSIILLVYPDGLG